MVSESVVLHMEYATVHDLSLLLQRLRQNIESAQMEVAKGYICMHSSMQHWFIAVVSMQGLTRCLLS